LRKIIVPKENLSLKIVNQKVLLEFLDSLIK